MNTEQRLNMTMLCDFYELTMGNGYFQAGYQDRITYFDVFFLDVPDKGGFAICAGLDQLIDYIKNNQPYYKKSIPEVNTYFVKRYGLK